MEQILLLYRHENWNLWPEFTKNWHFPEFLFKIIEYVEFASKSKTMFQTYLESLSKNWPIEIQKNEIQYYIQKIDFGPEINT